MEHLLQELTKCYLLRIDFLFSFGLPNITTI